MATVPSATFTHTAEEIDAAVDAVADKASQEDLDALAEAVEDKQDALTFDSIPTANSAHPVRSAGVYQADMNILSRLSYNYLFFTLDSLKSINTVGTWDGNDYERYGIHFTVNDDMTIRVHGTASQTAYFRFMDTTTFSGGWNGLWLYTGMPRPSDYNYEYYGQHWVSSQNHPNEYGNGLQIDTDTPGVLYFIVTSDSTVDFVLTPRICLQAYKDAPYIAGAPTPRKLYELILALQ